MERNTNFEDDLHCESKLNHTPYATREVFSRVASHGHTLHDTTRAMLRRSHSGVFDFISS